MTTFDEREDTFEKKFIHDENLRFQAFCHRNRLLAHWCADIGGEKTDQVQDYCERFVINHMQSSEQEIVQKVHQYLEISGSPRSIRDIRRHMALFQEQAEQHIIENGMLKDFRTFIQ